MKATVIEPTPKEGRREAHEDRDNKIVSGCQNNLELSLGMSVVNSLETDDEKGGGCVGGTSPRYVTTQEGFVLQQRNGPGLGGAKRCFSETTGGFVHPWSLAARQEKAVLEQAHQKPKPSSTVSRLRVSGASPASTETGPEIIIVVNSPPVVGWPPVRSFRRNLGIQNQPKSTMNSKAKVEEIEVAEKESIHNKLKEKPIMFVKVNMEGCTVGRKIDLKLHNGYDSLSHALQKMFHNFFSVNYLNNQKQDEAAALISPSYILLYEDNEGDRMLVGDVPWELFINSVERLYITLDPKHKNVVDYHLKTIKHAKEEELNWLSPRNW